VLAPLYLDGDGDLHAVFTKRRHDLRSHPGEISFPGGREDEADADLPATALRETLEEVGLPPDAVEILGALQPTPTLVTNFGIYPFVGLIEPGFRWLAQVDEVALVLELPLAAVRDGYARRRVVRRDVAFRTDTYQVGDHLIWGATARIVGDLLERLRPLV
jgi:8-oxo-dGTP pyrophosphatase MutT (NUDIX family)